MYCTRNCAHARRRVVTRAHEAPAFGWRSVAKRRKRPRARAEQAGGFPALGGGGRGVGAPQRGKTGSLDSGDKIHPCQSSTSPNTTLPKRVRAPQTGRRQRDITYQGGPGGRQRQSTDFRARAVPYGSSVDHLNHELLMSSVVSSEASCLVTLKQAAQRLGICRRTLERLIARGEFPSPLKIGRSSRVAVADVEAYVARLMDARGERRAS